jgi:hypothetical protein
MHADFHTLSHFLRQADRRRRSQAFLDWLPRGLLLGLGVALGLAFLARAQPLLTRTEIAGLGLSLILVFVAIVATIIMLRRRSTLDQARFADRQFRLRERASTAVEIHDRRLVTSPELATRQLQDALDVTSRIDLPRQLPLRPRVWDWVPVLVAIGLLGYLLWQPNRQELLLLEQRAIAAAIAEQTESLEAVAQAIAENENLTPEQQSALQQPVEAALEALSGQDLSREEAVAALSEAQGALRDLEARFENQGLSEALNRAAPALSQPEAGASLGEAIESGQLGNMSGSAAELAEDLANLDHGSQQALAQSLSEAAANLQNTDNELAGQLQAAADGLAAGDIESAEAALREVAEILQAAEQEQAAASQAGQAASALGTAQQEVAQAGNQAEPGSSETEGAGESGTGQNATGEMEEGGSGEQAAQQDGQQPGVGGPSQGGGQTANVFIPPSIDLSEVAGEDVELPVQCLGDPETCGPTGEQLPADPDNPDRTSGSIVPYERVFGIYRQTANEALRRGNIPLGLQGLVRDYFSSLEP